MRFEICVESAYEEELFQRLVAATETVGEVP
jgi:hypothetical protein